MLARCSCHVGTMLASKRYLSVKNMLVFSGEEWLREGGKEGKLSGENMHRRRRGFIIHPGDERWKWAGGGSAGDGRENEAISISNLFSL